VTDRFSVLLRDLEERKVRFVMIGVGGVNCYAPANQPIQLTQYRDLFLPADPENLLAAWRAAEASGLQLTTGEDPLDIPRDRWLAERIVERRTLTRAFDGAGLIVDFTLVMAGFEFDEAWRGHRNFKLGGASLPVARLEHLIASKAHVGRPKDLLFLETHKQALRDLLERGGT
jgi:predicted nucleotidyltransferase